MIQVGQPAPDFTLEGVLDGEFVAVNLAQQRGSWVVLFFYPLDFTFVCPDRDPRLRPAARRVRRAGGQGVRRERRQQVQSPRLVRARARQARVPAAVGHDPRGRSRTTACCWPTRATRCAARSSSTPRACCATWWCTTTTWGATRRRPCGRSRRCRRVRCVRSTGGRARRRCRPEGWSARSAEGLRRRRSGRRDLVARLACRGTSSAALRPARLRGAPSQVWSRKASSPTRARTLSMRKTSATTGGMLRRRSWTPRAL